MFRLFILKKEDQDPLDLDRGLRQCLANTVQWISESPYHEKCAL